MSSPGRSRNRSWKGGSNSGSSSSASSSRRAGGSSMRTGGRLGNIGELAIVEGEDETSDTEQDEEGVDPEVERKVREQGEFHGLINESTPEEFDQAKLVQVLTQPYIADNLDGDVVALDPHALKKLFTTTHSMLRRMKVEVEDETSSLSSQVSSLENDYLEGISAHSTRLYDTTTELQSVDNRFREVAENAVRIGDRLQKMEAQRVRAAEARQLLNYFSDFEALPDNFGDEPALMESQMAALPPIFSDPDQRREGAAMIAKIKAVTFELEAQHMQPTIRKIQAYSDFLENELLDLFERAAGQIPPKASFMREVSDILFLLNQGEHLQGRYVFFVVSQKLIRAEGGVGRAGSGTVAYDSLSALFGRVISLCQEEFALIQTVFPPPLVAKVIRLLLQRILNDPVYGVQARVEGVLSPQPPVEPLPLPDYLDCLCTVEQQTWALFHMLKAQKFIGEERAGGGEGRGSAAPAIGDGSIIDAADGRREVGEEDLEGAEGGFSSPGAALRKYLDEQARHLFFEHRSAYPQKETRYLLQSLYEVMVSVWEGGAQTGGNNDSSNGDAPKTPLPSASAVVDKMNALKAGISGGSGGGGESGVGGGVLEYRATGGATRMQSLDSFPVVRVDRIVSYSSLLAGPLRTSVLDKVFGYCSDAVRRCTAVLQQEGEEREQRISSFFQMVCRFLSNCIFIPCLEAAHHLLPSTSNTLASAALKEMQLQMKKSSPLPTAAFFDVIKAVSLASLALQEHYRAVVGPLLEHIPTLRTIVRQTRTAFLESAEGAAAKALWRAFEVVIVNVERQFSRGGKLDYCPKDDTGVPAIDATKAVKAVCALLRSQHSMAVERLTKLDMSLMWQKVGLRVRQLFVAHISRTKVNITGAFVLTNDVILLQSVLSTFDSPEVDASMQQLRELTNLFLVPPENLGSLMDTGMLAEMSKTDIVKYCRMRSDYFSHPGIRSAWAKEYFPSDEETSTNPLLSFQAADFSLTEPDWLKDFKLPDLFN